MLFDKTKPTAITRPLRQSCLRLVYPYMSTLLCLITQPSDIALFIPCTMCYRTYSWFSTALYTQTIIGFSPKRWVVFSVLLYLLLYCNSTVLYNACQTHQTISSLFLSTMCYCLSIPLYCTVSYRTTELSYGKGALQNAPTKGFRNDLRCRPSASVPTP